MRYWMLFTLRMIARAGLITSLLAMWLSQTTAAYFSARVSTTAFTVGWCPLGTFLQCHGPATGPMVTFGTQTFGDSSAFESQYYSVYQDNVTVLPGIRYGNRGSMAQAAIVIVSNWLLCLTFLIATIATSVRWKKPAAESEQERTGE